MAGEKHHHHLFHHRKEDGDQKPADPVKEEKQHKHKQLLGEFSTIAAGAFALHEKHKVKKDPENAHKHKIKGEFAATVAVGSAAYAFHEHHKKKTSKKEGKGRGKG